LSLVDFGRASLREGGGAYWLDDDGRAETDRPVESWITSRMAHVFGFAHVLGVPGAGEAADRALLSWVTAVHRRGGGVCDLR
jgi:mannose/cellobiose epimerase-like protein (N-acyl-D-glucosamine 2-epimerase family)